MLKDGLLPGSRKLTVLDLFAGAGGFTLAAEMAGGYTTKAFCEIDPYARKVLAKNWPYVPCYNDVTKLKGSDIGAVDVITGGFPCQDLSGAGKGAGIGDGTRSGLFREMLRLACEIREIQGRLPYIIFENVPRLLSGPTETPGKWFGEFLHALAEVGYDAEWFCVTAASVGAPHLRERVCVTAHPQQGDVEKLGLRPIQMFYESRETPNRFMHVCNYGMGWDIKSRVLRGRDGVPFGPHRVGMMGNAIVPQVFAPVMEALREFHFSC